MVAQTVQLIFSAAVRPEEIRALVEAMGGVRSPHSGRPNDTSLEGDRGRVWVGTHPVDEVSPDTGLLRAYAQALGAWPRSRVELEVSRQPGSERPAAEIVAAQWRVAIRGAGGRLMTIDELRALVAAGAHNPFSPGRP